MRTARVLAAWCCASLAAQGPALEGVPANTEEFLIFESRLRTLLPKVLPSLVSIGTGSGVVVEGGVVMTAAHISLGPGRDVRVEFGDGRAVCGRTLGVDHTRDLGLVQLPGARHPGLELAPPGSARPGDWCILMGHPGGRRAGRHAPVRLGRILALDDGGFLVTDCPMGPGDSGGPVLDLEGRVLGINSHGIVGVSCHMHAPAAAFRARWWQLAAGEVEGAVGCIQGVGRTPVQQLAALRRLGSIPARLTRNHVAVRRGLRDAARAARASTVEVLDADQVAVALGTVVSADRLVLTVASAVARCRDGLACRLASGRVVSARVLAGAGEDDLALLRLDLRSGDAPPPVALDTAAAVEPGRVVAVVGTTPTPLAVGVVSTGVHGRRDLQEMLGLRVDAREPRIAYLLPQGAAALHGLRIGDVIEAMGGESVPTSADLRSRIREHRQGDRVRLVVRRAGDREEVAIRLRRGVYFEESVLRPSRVRIGFSRVVQHDALVTPDSCGGPLVDVAGRVIGVNVSRAGCVEMLALTADVVRERVLELRRAARPR